MAKVILYGDSDERGRFYVKDWHPGGDPWETKFRWTRDKSEAQHFNADFTALALKYFPREAVPESKWVVKTVRDNWVTSDFKLSPYVFYAKKFHCKEDAAQHLAEAAVMGHAELSLKEV